MYNLSFYYADGSSTSTALGLRLAEYVFRTTPNRNATKVLLLATDGWSNDNSIPFGVLWPAAKLKVGLGEDYLLSSLDMIFMSLLSLSLLSLFMIVYEFCFTSV